MRHFAYTRWLANQRFVRTVNDELIPCSYAGPLPLLIHKEEAMDAQRIAVDAVVALTGCDRDQVTIFIRRFYLAGVTDPKRLTFKGLQAISRT
jgi:hypothetical protein